MVPCLRKTCWLRLKVLVELNQSLKLLRNKVSSLKAQSLFVLAMALLILPTGCSSSADIDQSVSAKLKAESEAKLGCTIWNEANLIKPAGSTDELNARYPSLSNFAAAARLDMTFLDLSFAAQQYFQSEFFAGPRPNFNKVQAYCFGVTR